MVFLNVKEAKTIPKNNRCVFFTKHNIDILKKSLVANWLNVLLGFLSHFLPFTQDENQQKCLKFDLVHSSLLYLFTYRHEIFTINEDDCAF